MRSSEPRRLVSGRRLGRPPDRLHVAYARPTRLERMAVMSPTRRDRSWDRDRDVRPSVHLQRVPRTIHRRPRRGGRSSTSRRRRGLRGRHRDPDGCHRSAFTRCPPDAHRWPPERHPPSDARGDPRRVANTPRTWATAQLSAALRRYLSPTRPDRPRRCLFCVRGQSSRTCSPGWLRGIPSAPSTGPRCPSTSRIPWRRGLACPPPPRRPSDHPRAALQDARLATSQGCRGIPARAFRSRLRRLRGASRVPSPDLRSAPSPNPRTALCLHLPGCLRLRRASGSNLLSRRCG